MASMMNFAVHAHVRRSVCSSVSCDCSTMGLYTSLTFFPTCAGEAKVAEESGRGLQEEGDHLSVQMDPKEKMTYTMQASKRTHCQRLARFIRLCDFIVVNMLHQFSVKSYSVLLENLQDQVTKSVEIVDLVTLPKGSEADEDDDDVEIPRIPTNVTSPRVGRRETVWV